MNHSIVRPMETGVRRLFPLLLPAAAAVAALLFLAALCPPTAWAEVKLTSVNADMENAGIGDTVTWTAIQTGGIPPVTYTFFLYRDSQITASSGPDTSNSYSVQVDQYGAYRAMAISRDAAGISTLSGGTVWVRQPISMIGLTASRKISPPGGTVVWTAWTEGGTGEVDYGFFLYRDGQLLSYHPTGKDNRLSIALPEKGTYTVHAYAGNYKEKSSLAGGKVIVKTKEPLKLKSVSANRDTAVPGQRITWSASASGGGGDAAFAFFLYRDNVLMSFNPVGGSGVYSCIPQEPGNYWVSVRAQSGLETDKLAGGHVAVSLPEGIRLTGVYANKKDALTGEMVTWTAQTENMNGEASYAFSIYRDGTLVASSDFGPSPSFAHVIGEPGEYKAVAYARDSVRTNMGTSAPLKALQTRLTLVSVTADQFSCVVGNPVTWKAESTGSTAPVSYLFAVYFYNQLVATSNDPASDTFTYVPGDSGIYRASVLAGDGHSTSQLESARIYAADKGGFRLLGIHSDKATAITGETVTWTVYYEGAPTNGPLLGYEVFDSDNLSAASSSGAVEDASFSFVPEKEGEYRLHIYTYLGDSPNYTSEPVKVYSLRFSDTLAWFLPPALEKIGALITGSPTPGPMFIPGEFFMPGMDFSAITVTPRPQMALPVPTPVPTGLGTLMPIPIIRMLLPPLRLP